MDLRKFAEVGVVAIGIARLSVFEIEAGIQPYYSVAPLGTRRSLCSFGMRHSEVSI